MKGQEDPLALEAAGRKRRLFLLRCASVSSGRADGLPSWSLPREPPFQFLLEGLTGSPAGAYHGSLPFRISSAGGFWHQK